MSGPGASGQEDGGDGRGDPATVPVGEETTFTFAVGVRSDRVSAGTADDAAPETPQVLDRGHTDLTVDLDTEELYAYSDPEIGTNQVAAPADEVVIEVPSRALEEVPDDPAFSFLGEPGEQVHQLPQAVLGRHVHGEIDPHLWQDVSNVRAYVQLIRDTLVETDPGGADLYQANASEYLAELDELDSYVRETIAQIPEGQRQLITTHDAFGYLAEAYDMSVAGFVVPNPAQEPSAQQLARLTDTMTSLDVPAVFLEPSLEHRASVLSQVAEDQDVDVCRLYGDAFDEDAQSYTAMMRHNADELLRCLGGGASAARLRFTRVAAGQEPGGTGGQPSQGEPSTVEGDEPLLIGETTAIGDGHIDIGPRFIDGEWTLLMRDDTVEPPAWRDLSDAVLQVDDQAMVQVPQDPEFGFLGEPGADVWLLPQVQQPGVVWPGWNTQDPEVATSVDQDVTWRLVGTDGPGHFILFFNEDFGQPSVLFDSREPYPQELGIERHTHAHANWAFTEPGVYLLDIEMAATVDGMEHSDTATVQLAVGTATDAADVFAAGESHQTSAGEAGSDAGGDDVAGQPPGGETESEAGGDGLMVAAAALALLIAVVGGGLVVARRLPVARRRRPNPTRASGDDGEGDGEPYDLESVGEGFAEERQEQSHE